MRVLRRSLCGLASALAYALPSLARRAAHALGRLARRTGGLADRTAGLYRLLRGTADLINCLGGRPPGPTACCAAPPT